MSIVLFILALAAGFIGTIFAFRAVSRIHNGESYTYESTACAVCVTLIVLALMLREIISVQLSRFTIGGRCCCIGPL